MITLTVETEQEEDGRWLAEVPEIPGCLAYGATEVLAVQAAQALALHALADQAEHGELKDPSLDTVRFERREPVALQ